MKLHFEPDLDFQLQAIEAVCDLFRGQEICRDEFTVTPQPADRQGHLADVLNEFGIGNRLILTDPEIHENLNAVQLRNGLPPSTSLDSGDFTVEMETGTGKTCVYLRTILELHKRYGFTKFIVVVPSVAIKEGVYKSPQITEDHLRALYTGTPFGYFLYDSMKLGQVRNFATSPHIQIMVVTVGAINKKDDNNLYKDSEKTGGEKPVNLIKATRPILVVDEPQSVDGGLTGRGKQAGRGKDALEAMAPLCTLRYSATHVNKHHMVYRLDAVDAYERKLVKQTEVASATVEDAHNKPYVRLVSTSNRRGVVSAKVELDVERAGRVRRVEKSVHDGDDLERTSGRDVYRDCRIGEIRVGRGSGFVELQTPGGEHYLRPGEAWGDVDVLAVQRQMIRRTIREHLDKEKRLRPQGIKEQAIVDGIKYQRLGDAAYYAQTLFEDEELSGYLKNLLDTAKSVYEQIVYDSGAEAAFADQLEKNGASGIRVGYHTPSHVMMSDSRLAAPGSVLQRTPILFPPPLRGKVREGASALPDPSAPAPTDRRLKRVGPVRVEDSSPRPRRTPLPVPPPQGGRGRSPVTPCFDIHAVKPCLHNLPIRKPEEPMRESC